MSSSSDITHASGDVSSSDFDKPRSSADGEGSSNVAGETDPRTPMGPADRVPFSSAGAEIARRADRGEAHEQFTQLRSSPER